MATLDRFQGFFKKKANDEPDLTQIADQDMADIAAENRLRMVSGLIWVLALMASALLVVGSSRSPDSMAPPAWLSPIAADFMQKWNDCAPQRPAV